MAKIFKDNKTKKVVIVGVGDFFPNMLEYTVTDEIVTVTLMSTERKVFDAHWDKILDQDGNPFVDEATAMNYIHGIFQDVEILEKEELDGESNGSTFLDYYNLAKA